MGGPAVTGRRAGALLAVAGKDTNIQIAKLARFHKTDRDDIAAMAALELIEPQRFAERFRSATQRWWHDSRADDLPQIVRNFHQVQSDELFVGPSRVELPPWVDDD